MSFGHSAFITQAEEAIDQMIHSSTQSDITFAGQVLDALVTHVLADATPFDNNVSQLRSLIVISLSRIPDDRFSDLRAYILERAYRRVE